MDIARADKIADITKTITDLGRSIKNPATLQYGFPQKAQGGPSRLPPPVGGSTVVRILMYIAAGILVIGLILLVVDQAITPIFQRNPGGAGYIPIPGTDTTQVIFTPDVTQTNFKLGTASEDPGKPNGSLITGQPQYSITMDICIKTQTQAYYDTNNRLVPRGVFYLGTSSSDDSESATPKLTVTLDNFQNDLNINIFLSDGTVKSMTLENVPLYVPFRLGITVSSSMMNAYLNGLLVISKQINKGPTGINSPSIYPTPPAMNDIIYASSNIKSNVKLSSTTAERKSQIISSGTSLLNIRMFSYIPDPSEMLGRMRSQPIAGVSKFPGN
jgi:hypothetical protein